MDYKRLWSKKLFRVQQDVSRFIRLINRNKELAPSFRTGLEIFPG